MLTEPEEKLIADLLRQAAQCIWETDANVTKAPWISIDDGDRIVRDPEAAAREDDSNPCGEGPPLEYVVDEPLTHNPANGDHIALFDPDVSAIMAKLLVELAEEVDQHGLTCHPTVHAEAANIAARIMAKTGRDHPLLAKLLQDSSAPA